MDTSAQFDAKLAKTFRCSRYAERLCTADPARRRELFDDGDSPFTALTMREVVDRRDQTQYESEAELRRALRKLRQRVMLRLIFRDINGLANLDEVVTAISALADVTLSAALDFHGRAVAKAFGLSPTAQQTDARAQLLVVGMGKLGAHELNVSSDIDLIFVHAEDGDATAERSWHEFHVEVGKRVIRALDAVDEDGFVFRVDMRLRPFGDSGPLVSSLSTMENYFLAHARPWERYAWLKARAITGATSIKTALMNLVTPFVYRRYHDFGAIEEMRDLHAQIRAEATKRNRLNDIKVGPGGIREVEFIVQLHQLIRGGREHRLQLTSTREALGEIGRHGLLESARVDQLRAAYVFLRNLEHRLQYVDDQQTQALPTMDEEQQRIAEAMNCADWPAFEIMLNTHRAIITREFDALFAASDVARDADTYSPAIAQSTSTSQAATALDANIHAVFCAIAGDDAAKNSFPDIAQRVLTWQNAARTATLSPRTRQRISGLIPAALKLALAEEMPQQTFFRVLDLLDAIDKRETYIALLAEYPDVLARVTRIAARSAWAAELLRRHPVLLDELGASRAHIAAIDWATERARLAADCDHARGDTEQLYEILRHAKQVITLRLNIADIEGQLGVMALSDELSALADMLLEAALQMAWKAIGGVLQSADNASAPRGFAIIGYGKLGSKELGYASDLDLVFLYDPAAGIPTEIYSRLAQRLSSWLNTMTSGGVLYETDLRLRPDGAAGLLVSSIDAFSDYQQQRAWTWEHQALTRARWCAGDKALAAPFEAIRKAVLRTPRDRQKLRSEIVEMRDKMRAEKDKKREDKKREGESGDPQNESPAQFDLKHVRGGIVDVEFIVQYLILAYAAEHPEFIGNLGNFALLTRAGALGILDEDIAARVAKAYLAYRERQHRARTNNEERTWIGLDELADERRAVTAAWTSLLG